MHRLLLVFLLLSPCGFVAFELPKVCPGMRPLLADRNDKTMFPDYASQWYYAMPFVKALRWYQGDRPCQIIAGNFYIAHIMGIRQSELDSILREIQVIEGFLHIHAVDFNISLPKLQTIYAKELTGRSPSNKTSAVYVEDFGGSWIRMPELRDVGRGNFAVRRAPKLCGWKPDSKRGFFPGQFTQKRAKHYSKRVVTMDEETPKYAKSFSHPSCRQRKCPVGCTYCFDEETCQQPTKIGCEEACGPDEFCDSNDSGGVFCCKDGNHCLGSCSDFARAFCINAGWSTTVLKGGTVSAMTCNACAEGSYELWLDPAVGKHCVPCVSKDTKSGKRPYGSTRHGPICMAKTEYSSNCYDESLYDESTNSCHYKCPYGTSQGGRAPRSANSFTDISRRGVYSACYRCDMKYDDSVNNLAPACMHECRLFHDLSFFNLRNLYPTADEFRLKHFNPYKYGDYAVTEDDVRDCHILASDLNITHLTTDSPYPGTRVPPDFLQVISRISIVRGSLTITDTDLLLVPFLRMLTMIQKSAIVRRNAHMVTIDLSRFGDKDICENSSNKTQCREESRITDNGKWINPTGASNTAEGACGSAGQKCAGVEGLPMDAKNVRYTAGAYINTRADCTSTTFASGLCRLNGCPRDDIYSVLVRNHQAYYDCTKTSACTSKWEPKYDNRKMCHACSDECLANPKDPKNPLHCTDGPHQCLYECKSGFEITLNKRKFCRTSEKCPSGYYASGKDCKMCDPVCITCGGPGHHFGKDGCTKCSAVYLEEVGGKYRESCVHPSPRPSCMLGDSCQARDFNPAYEISKDLPPYIGD